MGRSCRKNLSFGVGVSPGAAQSVPSEARRRLGFQTTKGHDLQGLALAPEHRAGPSGAVANGVAGRLDYAARRAPLADRGFSTQVREHDEKPFLDFKENRRLYEMNKRPIPGVVCNGAEKPLGATSAYSEEFSAPSKEQRRASRPSIHRPSDNGQTVGLRGYSAATRSTSQDHHRICAALKPQQPRVAEATSLGPIGQHTEFALKTQYQVDFGLRRLASAQGDEARQALRQSLSAPQIRGLDRNEEMFAVPRVCGLGAGR